MLLTRFPAGTTSARVLREEVEHAMPDVFVRHPDGRVLCDGELSREYREVDILQVMRVIDCREVDRTAPDAGNERDGFFRRAVFFNAAEAFAGSEGTIQLDTAPAD